MVKWLVSHLALLQMALKLNFGSLRMVVFDVIISHFVNCINMNSLTHLLLAFACIPKNCKFVVNSELPIWNQVFCKENLYSFRAKNSEL